MKEYSIKEIQQIDLQILLEFVRVCEKYHLTYWLSSGTLLGAVRHKGFIPWDDDVDMEMPIEDYKKFCKVAQIEFGDKYFLQTYKTDKYFDMQFAKIRKNGTTSMPVNRKDWRIHWGICIDVFPIIGLYPNAFLQKLQWALFKINATLLSADRKYYSHETTSKMTRLIHFIPRKLRNMVCGLNNCVILKKFHSSSKGTMLWGGIGPWWTKDSCREDTVLMFENHPMTAPCGYDYILTHLYGDYMTPPPKEEQAGHELHLGEIIFDLEKDYKKYL